MKVLQPHFAFRSLGWDTRPAQAYPEPMLGGTKTLQAHQKRLAVMGKQITHGGSSLLGLGGEDIRRKTGCLVKSWEEHARISAWSHAGVEELWSCQVGGVLAQAPTPAPVSPALGSSSDWRIQEGLGWESSRCPQEACNAL